MWHSRTLEEVWKFILKTVVFFIQFLAKAILKLKKLNYGKRQISFFNGPFIVKQMFSLLEFVTALLPFACVREINKNKSLMFLKVEASAK